MRAIFLFAAMTIPNIGTANATDPVTQNQETSLLHPNLISMMSKEIDQSIEDCYQEALQINPKIGGSLRLKMLVNNDGSVVESEIQGSTLSSPHTEKCIEQSAYELSFPSSDEPTIVSYPVVFRSNT